MRFLKAKVGAKEPPFWRKGVFRGPHYFITKEKAIATKIGLHNEVVDDHGERPPDIVGERIISPVVGFCK